MNWNKWLALVKSDFLIRYQNSLLGFVWVFLKPFLIFVVLLFVFSVFRQDIPHFALSLLLGIVLFQFFSDGTSFGMRALLDRRHLLLRLSFSPDITIFASLTSPVIHLVFALLLFGGFCVFEGVIPSAGGVFVFFLLLCIEWFFMVGLAFFLSLGATRFRDLTEIWDVFLVALFYLVPIFYPFEIIPEALRRILWWNPLTQIVVFSRNAILLQKLPEASQILYLFGISLGVFCFGYIFFHFCVRRTLEKL